MGAEQTQELQDKKLKIPLSAILKAATNKNTQPNINLPKLMVSKTDKDT